MQHTCRTCNNLIPPGATACIYCGTPITSPPYGQQGFPPPPGTQYNPYTQPTSPTSDPYAAQYNQPAPPPVPPTFGTSGFSTPSAPPFSTPSAPPFSTPSAPALGAPPQQPAFFQQPPPQPRRSSGALIGIILAVLILLGGLGTGAFFLLRKSGSANTTPTPAVTATPTTSPSLYQSNLTQQTNDWDCGDATCTFNPDGYHITAPDNFVYKSLLTKQAFTDTIIQINGIISQGDPKNAGLAIAFRTPPASTQAGYAFLLFGDGTYAVVRWNDQGKATEIVPEHTSSSIRTGLQQQNSFKLIVTGTEFTFFINDQQIAQIADSTYTQGYIGLGASGKGTVAIFSDLLITKPAS